MSEKENTEKVHTAIVFYCRFCNGLMFAAVNNEHIAHSADEISKMLKDSYRMFLIPVEDVRSVPWCSCNGDQQLTLEGMSEVEA